MKKDAKKWLIGSGIVAIGAGALVALKRAASKYMVKLAMDRNGPKAVERDIKKASGRPENAALEEENRQAQRVLEACDIETVEITSADGLRLVGHWYPAKEPKRILVAMHGWRSTWSRDFAMIAPFWHNSGCSVLFAEQRGQGKSDGDYMGFGMLERHDCLNWIDWVNENNKDALPVYLVGLSMGATTVLMASSLELPDNVHGIMADCGFTSAYDIWKHVVEENLHLHYGLYASAADDLCKKKIHMGSRDCSTVDSLQQCHVPVLFIHGTDDSFVPIRMTYDNYKACAAPKKLLIVPGAEHALSYCVERALYEKASLDFWQEYDSYIPKYPEENSTELN